MCTKSWYRRLALLLVVVLCFSLPLQASAHSGRTDSNGGHRDNKNIIAVGIRLIYIQMGFALILPEAVQKRIPVPEAVHPRAVPAARRA